MSKKYDVAVIGATGSVGRETLAVLAERSFPINNIYAISSDKSAGSRVSFGESVIKTSIIDNIEFEEVDIAFFCVDSELAKKYIPVATSKGCIVIDKSSCFRLDDAVPLVVPEANLGELAAYNAKNIIANPNCCVIPLAVVLKPLDNHVKIKRVVVSTYQSVSGAGKAAMDELYEQTKSKYVFSEVTPKVFPKQIAFNLFPHIGDIEQDGYTGEELKIMRELRKVIGDHISVTVTSVRVPVFVSHSMSVNIEFSDKIDMLEASEILQEADGVLVVAANKGQYISPIDVVGEDAVYVTRIRDDKTLPNSLNLWITCDNLRKGAAVNSVQIAEELLLLLGRL